MVSIVDCTSEYFLRNIKEDKIIAFGAGRKFIEFVTRHKLENNIEFVLDNFKIGTIDINGKIIEILPPEKLFLNNTKEIRLLITNTYNISEILRQIDSMKMFEGCDCYICALMLENANNQKIEYTRGMDKIPKIIHYCWFGKKEIPDHLKRYMESWNRICDDYEIKRWDESNYDISKNEYMRQAYISKKWGFVPDYARLDIIYQNGGIYLDTDVEVTKKFDDLLKDESFMGFNDNSDVALGLGFGAVKGNKIIKYMMEEYDNVKFINEDGSFNLKICSEYQMPVLKRMGFEDNGLFQKIDGNVLYPMEVFNPCGKIGIYNHFTDNTHSIHRNELSYETDVNKKGYRDRDYIKERVLKF